LTLKLKGLINHYKFSQEIVDELQISYAPVPEEGQGSHLGLHLETLAEFKGKLASSGLFSFKDPVNEPFYDFYNACSVMA
jgi:hypothetical protein